MSTMKEKFEKLDDTPDKNLTLAQRNVKRYASREDYTNNPFYSDNSNIIIVNGAVLKDVVDFSINIDYESYLNKSYLNNFDGKTRGEFTITRCISAYPTPAYLKPADFFLIVTNNEYNDNLSYTCGCIIKCNNYKRFATIDNFTSKNTIKYIAGFHEIDKEISANEIKLWAGENQDIIKNVAVNNLAQILYIKLKTEYPDPVKPTTKPEKTSSQTIIYESKKDDPYDLINLLGTENKR